MKIGFVGLGIMRKPMVRNLLKAGHEVWVNNRSKAPMEELVKDGSHAVSRQELAENSEMLDAPVSGGEPKAVAEAFTLAQKAGVDPEVVYRTIRGGLAGSFVMDARDP